MNIFKCFAVLSFITISIVSCGKESSKANNDLIAKAGFDQTIRSGSNVLLSGKYSEKKNAIEKRIWTAKSDLQGGKLVPQKNKGVVKFIAPVVTQTQAFEFGYFLSDNKGNTSSDSVTITVVPGDDPDRFLDAGFRDAQRIVVTVASESAQKLASPTSFNVSAELEIHYQLEGRQVAASIDDVKQTLSGKWFTNTEGRKQQSDLHPKLNFKLPQLYLLDLQDVIDEKITADQITSTLIFNASGSASITPYLYITVEDNVIAEGTPPIRVSYDELRQKFKADSHARAIEYYQLIDPDKKKMTLCNWKQENGVTAQMQSSTFDNGVFEVEGGRVIHQKYLNGYDLGFARDMYVFQKDNGEVVAWVVNYPSIDAMNKQTDAIATVTMEFGLNLGVDAYTRFYTYAETPEKTLTEDYLLSGTNIRADDPCFTINGNPKEDQGHDSADFRRKLTVGLDFDGRGFKYMPDACTVCHGGTNASIEFGDKGNVDSSFLPWDVHNLFLDDKEFSCDKLVIPMAMAIGRLNIALLKANIRHLVSMIAVTGEVMDSHSAAVLIGYGASAIYPNLLFSTALSQLEKKNATSKPFIKSLVLKYFLNFKSKENNGSRKFFIINVTTYIFIWYFLLSYYKTTAKTSKRTQRNARVSFKRRQNHHNRWTYS